MTRSLLVTKSHFPPARGGISTLVAGIAGSLGPDFVACYAGVERGTPDDDRGLDVRRVRLRGRNETWREGCFLAGLLGTLRGGGFGAIQFSEVADAVYAQPLLHGLRLPTLIYAHGNEVLAARKGAWGRSRRALREADAVVVLSEFTRGALIEIGVNASRIHRIRPGCDPVRFAPAPADPAVAARILGAQAGARVLLSVGRLVARKGHDLVIRALPEILRVHEDVIYLIVGQGPNEEPLRALARAGGLSDRVVFTGELSDDLLPPVYNLAELFLMPCREDLAASDVEGFGLVFLEAAASGVAAIGGRSGGVEDAIEDGRTGFLVDPGSPDGLADAVSRMLGDPERSKAMGRAARERLARDGFSWEKAAHSVQRVLADLRTT